MKFIKVICILLSAVFLFFCSDGGQQTGFKKDVKVNFATKGDNDRAARDISIGVDTESLIISEKLVSDEECDGRDNDNDGFFDEMCFGCCKDVPAGDFNCDGTVTMLDCSFPLLIAKSKTIAVGSTKCADLDKDNRIGMGDVNACLNILKQK